MDVFFDDFKVTHVKSPIVSTSDYYPYGLTFNSYQRENSVENRYLFNGGSELQQDLNLGFYSTLFRTYDPSIGRFMQVDPLADFMPGINPYSFAFDNPVLFGDPYGLAPMWWLKLRAGIKQAIYNVTGRGNQHAVIHGKHKGKRVEVGAKTQNRDMHKPTSNPAAPSLPSAFDESPIVNLNIPAPEFPEIDLKIEEPSIPEPKANPNPGRRYRAGDELLVRSNIFKSGTSEFLNKEGVNRTLTDAYRSLIQAPYMKVIISATTNLTWSSHTNWPVKGSNGKVLQDVLNDRAQVVKQALIDLGIPENQIEIGKRPLYGDLDGITESAFQLRFEKK